MSEKNNTEIDELLSALVDDEATERQKNEFIRLVRNDPSIADRLAMMQRQKQMIAALPVEAAPESLADDIRAALERKHVLGDVPAAAKTSVAGAGHLFMRRILTTAAMLLLPIGLLSFVVYEIIKPPSEGPVKYSSVENRLDQDSLAGGKEPIAPVVAKILPFDGVLTFRTDQPMSVSNFVEKMIFDKGLIGATVPSRTADVATYEITAPPENIKMLVDSLESVWPHCQQISLNVSGGVGNDAFEIPFVGTEQIATLVAEDSRPMLNRLADQYVTANANKGSYVAHGEVPDALPSSIPIPTGKQEMKPSAIDPSLPAVRLQIHIERVME